MTSKEMDCCTDRFTTSSNSLSYVRIITVNGPTSHFTFLKYYERLLLEGLMLNGLQVYLTTHVLPLVLLW